MTKTSLLDFSPRFEEFGKKAESFLTSTYPQQLDEGNIHSISMGRNKDAAPGQRGGFRVAGVPSLMASALMFETPRRMIMDNLLADPDSKKRLVVSRATDAVLAVAAERVRAMLEKNPNMSKREAQSRVADSISSVGFFDAKAGQFVVHRTLDSFTPGRVKDSVLSGLQTPYWDIAQIPKVFNQPFLRLYAKNLVNEVGIPNIWANLVQVYTQTFEGYARLANAAKGNGEFTTSTGVKNRTSTIISEMVNVVIDYEAPTPNDQKIGGMPGNWLSNAVIGDRDAYANLMLEQLCNLLYYFGDAASGFDGLTQIANRDGTYTLYPASQPPAEYLWQHDGAGTGTGPVNETVGATLLLVLNHMIAEKVQALNFLPVTVDINVSPILYKALRYSMLSKVFNQNNPLSIIKTAFEAEGKIRGTMATGSMGDVFSAYTLTPDPALMPNTPFNPTAEDLTFITFKQFQSAMDDAGLTDLVMAPTAISKMILPSAPGFRDGVVRTALTRIGSLIAPVEGTVHIISGMGINSRYTPPST